uniref:Syndecan n=1 Tax=Callithrix jacchus TaxID=9483 RepID=A0A8I3WYH2_CALJA
MSLSPQGHLPPLSAHPGCQSWVSSPVFASSFPRPSAGAVRTLRGPWTWRALGTMTPFPMMNWMTSTRGRALATSSRSQALRKPCASAQMWPWQCPPHLQCCPPRASSPWAHHSKSSPLSAPPRSQRATAVSTTMATTAATTTGALTVATVPVTVTTAAPSTPAAPPVTATTAVVRTTGVQRLLPLPLTTAATARATTPEAPSPPTTVAVLDTEAPTPRLVSTATSRPRALPRPATTQEPDSPERSTLPLGTTAPGPTEVAQTPTPETYLTTVRDEPEVPVSGGPSGDFELPEEETTQPDTANEVVAVGGAAAKPSPPPGTLPKGARPGPGLLDNAIDSGSSAAQLPQKSILERKEVLVAVIVGGVVGALFAAFLVTLLIYRMKKKDEGSYTLEEPKQASVTYQKPDKQEEFYA